MFGWLHRLDGHEFEQALGVGDGQGGLACCSPWGWKSQTRLSDWTDLNWELFYFKSMLIGRCSRWLKRKFCHFLPTSCLSSCLLCWLTLKYWSPNVLVPGTSLEDDIFSTDRGEDGFRVIQAYYTYCTLYCYYYCISPTSDRQALDLLGLEPLPWRKGFPGDSGLKKKIRLPMQETQVRSLGWEDSPGEGSGNPPQYSCLENPMDRGAWWATVHGVSQNRTPLRQLSTHAAL